MSPKPYADVRPTRLPMPGARAIVALIIFTVLPIAAGTCLAETAVPPEVESRLDAEVMAMRTKLLGKNVADGLSLVDVTRHERMIEMTFQFNYVDSPSAWRGDKKQLQENVVALACNLPQLVRLLKETDATLVYRYTDSRGGELMHFGVDRSTCGEVSSGDYSATTTMSSSNAMTANTTQPRYRKEYVKGQAFLVGEANGVEVWAYGQCLNSSCRKFATYLFLRNGSNRSFSIVPEQNVEMFVVTGDGKVKQVETYPASAWVSKEKTKATWRSVFTGVATGLAYANMYTSFRGGYTTPGGGRGTYYGSISDPIARIDGATRTASSFGNVIARAFERNTVGLLWPETLSPGEAVGGRVHFKKLKCPRHSNSAAVLRVTVGTGADASQFIFRWSLP